MKKTRILALTLALAMVMAMTGAFALDLTNESPEGSMEISYTIPETYSVVIPESVNLTAETPSATGTVSASDVRLAANRTLKVTMDSINNFYLKNGESAVEYTVSDQTGAISDGGIVLSVQAGTTSGSNSLTFATTAEKIKAATLSGNHIDTLTFTITVQ